MQWIRKRREELGLTQEHLGREVGISRKRVSELEGGLFLPRPALARELERVLKLKGIPDRSQLFPMRGLRRLGQARPFDLVPVNSEPWQRMEAHFESLLRQLRVPEAVAEWMRRFLPCDSGHEGLALFQLAAAGARPLLLNPHQCGYRKQAILDAQGEALAERPLAGLHWRCKSLEALLWPQVRLMSGFRLDFLIRARRAGSRRWLAVELDGLLHKLERDARRDRMLGLSVLRVPLSEVKSLALAGFLESRLIETDGC